jgi:cholesterol transport system auxiliary component
MPPFPLASFRDVRVQRLHRPLPASIARRLALGAMLIAGVAGLGACSVLSGDPPRIYDLTAPKSLATVRAATSAQILVPEPSAVKAVDSDRIMVREAGNEISYLGDAQWSDRLPRLVQLRLVEALENSGRVKAVGRPGQGLLIDYQLVTDIRAFELSVGGGRRVVVEIGVKLMNDRTGKVIATETFRAEAPAGGDAPALVVRALDQAFGTAVADLANWAFKRI